MKHAIENGKFIEFAEVHGNFYGTSFEAIQHVQRNNNQVYLLDIDVQGIKYFKYL